MSARGPAAVKGEVGADVNAKVRRSKAFIKAQNIKEKTEEQYFANV